jgi:hypothetical protein
VARTRSQGYVSAYEVEAVYFPLVVDYLVVAGGGGGGGSTGTFYGSGGGGAVGLRSTVTATGGGGSLETALTLIASTNYTVTVGAGGGRCNKRSKQRHKRF